MAGRGDRPEGHSKAFNLPAEFRFGRKEVEVAALCAAIRHWTIAQIPDG